MGNLIVAQSGGPTAVINASLAGVIGRAYDINRFDNVYGAVNGISGVINDNLISLDEFKDKERLSLLSQTPASYLGSCRLRLSNFEDDGADYVRIFDTFKKHNITAFMYIGGNDSMDTVSKLSTYAERNNIKDISIIGVPKTIDNDLYGTDHSPGFGSAGKFIANSVRQLSCDADVYDLKSVLIVEIMGRHAGWLTACASLANTKDDTCCDIVCLPEVPFDIDALCEKIKDLHKVKNTVLVAVSEGIKTKDGEFYATSSIGSVGDKFGHTALGGVGARIALDIKEHLGVKTRAVELNTLQRAASAYGSKCDYDEAMLVGNASVDKALEGKTGIMLGYKRVSDEPYKMEICEIDIHKSANAESKVPDIMIDGAFGVTDAFRTYAMPLIAGEPERKYKDGLYVTIRR